MTPMMSNMEDLDRAWSWVVLVSSFGFFMIFGMFLYGVGVVNMVLLDEYGGKSASTAWAGSLYAALVSLGGPVSSIIIDKYSCRSAMALDGLLTTVGCFVTAFSPSLPLCIFTFGIVAGIGGGIGYTANMVVVGFNFRRMRNIALGIAISGVGIGTCILSPVMELVREFYGNRGYFIIMAGIGLHKCLFATLCRPSELEIARQQCLREEEKEDMSKRQLLKHYAKVYTNKIIISFSLSLMLFSAGTYMIFLHLPVYAVSKSFTPIAASLLLSACGLSTVASRVAIGVIADRKDVDEMVLYSGSFGSLALGTFLFPLYSKSYVGLMAFSIILGSYFGGCYAIMNTINIRIVGMKYLTIATGMELLFCGVGTAIGPIITGFIVDEGGTHEHAFMLAAFLILIGAALGMATVVFQPSDDNTETPDLNLIVTKDGEVFNESGPSEPFTLTKRLKRRPKKRNSGIEEIQNIDCCSELGQCGSAVCHDFTNCGESGCAGGACATPTTPEMTCQLLTPESLQIEPMNFTEEIQKLLNGEELLFADDSDA